MKDVFPVIITVDPFKAKMAPARNTIENGTERMGPVHRKVMRARGVSCAGEASLGRTITDHMETRQEEEKSVVSRRSPSSNDSSKPRPKQKIRQPLRKKGRVLQKHSFPKTPRQSTLSLELPHAEGYSRDESSSGQHTCACGNANKIQIEALVRPPLLLTSHAWSWTSFGS